MVRTCTTHIRLVFLSRQFWFTVFGEYIYWRFDFNQWIGINFHSMSYKDSTNHVNFWPSFPLSFNIKSKFLSCFLKSAAICFGCSYSANKTCFVKSMLRAFKGKIYKLEKVMSWGKSHIFGSWFENMTFSSWPQDLFKFV